LGEAAAPAAAACRFYLLELGWPDDLPDGLPEAPPLARGCTEEFGLTKELVII